MLEEGMCIIIWSNGAISGAYSERRYLDHALEWSDYKVVAIATVKNLKK